MTDDATVAAERDFDPSPYLTKIGGADYLPVAARLLWLRKTHPDAVIAMTLVGLDMVPGKGGRETERAIFTATVSIPSGGSATGYGSETRDDFHDHIEKASTKALGRALAALGFGTQFAPEMEDGHAQGRVVDAPQARPHQRTNGTNPAPAIGPDGLPRPVLAPLPNEPVADARRIRFLHGHGEQHQLDHDALKALAWPLYRVYHLEELSNRQVNDFVRRIAEGELCTPVPPPSNGDPTERAQRVPDPALT